MHLRLRLRDRLRQPGAGGRSAGIRRASPPPRLPERLGEPDHVERVHGLGRGSTSTTRAIPIGQAFLGPVRREVRRQPSRILRDGACNRDVAPRWCAPSPTRIPPSPRGVKEALERVKMMPAASGAAGNPCVTWQVDACAPGWAPAIWWPGRLDADGVNSHLVDRFGEEG